MYSFLPEADVLFPHDTLYNMAMSSALMRKIHLMIFAKPQKVNRVTPDEMIESYRRVLTVLQHDID